MKRLPLYPTRETVIERTPGKGIDPDCTACAFHTTAESPCIAPEGSVGENTLLVIGQRPTRVDDRAGSSFMNDAGMWIRQRIAALWDGDVVYTYGVRCYGGGREPSDKVTESCRPYLAELVEKVKPTRIVTFGSHAVWSLLGRKVPPLAARQGYSYLGDETPVMQLAQLTTYILGNTFRQKHLLEDLTWALKTTPPLPPWDAKYNLIETPADAELAAERIDEHGEVTFDTEYSGPLHTEYFTIDTLAAALTGTVECYVWDEKALNNPAVTAPLKRVMSDDAISKTGHNIKVDIKAVAECPNTLTEVQGELEDTLIYRKLDDPDVAARLAYQTELVGMGGHKGEMERALTEAVKIIEETRSEWNEDMVMLPGMLPRALEAAVKYPGLDPHAFAYALVPSTLRSRYCALDTVGTSLLKPKFAARVESREYLDRTWNVVLASAPRTVAQIERWGFPADRQQIRTVGTYCDAELSKYRAKLDAHGCPDVSKNEKLAEFLYTGLGLRCHEFTDTGNPSVAASALKKLKGQHPVIEDLMAYKEVDTIRTRYSWNLLDHIRADGRIHGSFNITGTVSGRWSSSDPNMQNIPSRSPLLAKMVKNIFVASPGHRLVQIDYSQLEYRIAALLSGDQVMQQVYRDGLDLHRRTAELISEAAWGIKRATMEGYDKDQIKPYRSAAKSVNFGTLYGLGVGTLAKDLGISKAKAQKLVDSIMGQFTDLDRWVKKQIGHARQYGYVHTYFDGKPARWRPLWNIDGKDDGAASSARNSAINSPVQGSAADYMTRSLNEIVDWILADGIDAKVVCTVHDSVILEIVEDEVEDVTATVVDIMESWYSGTVPLVADVEVGPKWGKLTEVPKMADGSLDWAAAA